MKSHHQSLYRLSLVACICLVFLVIAFISPAPSANQLTPTPTVDRLAAPPLPPQPSQADLGAQVYYQVCMACHGDKGQGLTEEWRAVWGEDSNCWQSECHSFDHPPQGFFLIETCCKAVMGPGTLERFKDGQELFTYIIETMPWWNPGYLKTEEFWQVTAFLLRAHGAFPNEATLDSGNAFIFKLRPASPLPGDQRPEALAATGMLAVMGALFYLYDRLHG